MSRLCKQCQEPISEKRLAALPHTRTCLGCSDEQPVRGHMITPHKTGSHIQLLTPSQHAWVQSVNHRKGYGANLPMEAKRT